MPKLDLSEQEEPFEDLQTSEQPKELELGNFQPSVEKLEPRKLLEAEEI